MQLDQNVHILLVEDDEVDIKNIERGFEKNNIANPLSVARDGVEALDMLRGNNGQAKLRPMPKVVLLDINMPRMSGLEFLEEVRKDAELRSLIIFMLTSSDEEKDKMIAYGLNVAGYIVKPVGANEFETIMSRLALYWNMLELPDE